MNDIDEILIHGSEVEISEWMANNDGQCVIDWRSSVEEVINEITQWLPEGYFSYDYKESESSCSLTIYKKSKRKKLKLRMDNEAKYIVLLELGKMLRNDYELKLLESSLMSDTQLLLLRRKEWWSQYRAAARTQCYSLFVDATVFYMWVIPTKEKLKRPLSLLKALHLGAMETVLDDDSTFKEK